jgi:hypothetical protein
MKNTDIDVKYKREWKIKGKFFDLIWVFGYINSKFGFGVWAFKDLRDSNEPPRRVFGLNKLGWNVLSLLLYAYYTGKSYVENANHGISEIHDFVSVDHVLAHPTKESKMLDLERSEVEVYNNMNRRREWIVAELRKLNNL